MGINERVEFERDEDGMLLDCSHLTGWIKNPYAKNVHRERTIIMNEEIIKKFEILAEEKGIDREELITNVLKNYLANNRPNFQ